MLTNDVKVKVIGVKFSTRVSNKIHVKINSYVERLVYVMYIFIDGNIGLHKLTTANAGERRQQQDGTCFSRTWQCQFIIEKFAVDMAR